MEDFRYFILKTFNLFSNGTIRARNAMTREEYERQAPKIDPALVAHKNALLLHPNKVPDFYIKAVDQHKPSIKVGGKTYHAESFIEGSHTGLRAALYGTRDGDRILLFNGIAKPWRSESTPFDKPAEFGRGLNDVTAAADGMYGPQMRAALRLYQKIVSHPTTRKMQVVGYSLGSAYANEIAARFGQNAVTFANLGTHPKLADPIRIDNIQKHVTDIQLRGDSFAGLAGKVHAKERDITKPYLSGGHTPKDYALHADTQLAEAALHQRLAKEKAYLDRASAITG